MSLLFKEFSIVLTIQGIWCPYYSRNLVSLLFKEFGVLTIQGIFYCPYYSRTFPYYYIMTVLTVSHDSVAVQLKVIYFSLLYN